MFHPSTVYTDYVSWNTDEPDSLRYSILDQMEKYRKNGVFHLRICFPDYTEDEFPCNEWEQSSNFVLETTVSGFKAIRLTFLDLVLG